MSKLSLLLPTGFTWSLPFADLEGNVWYWKYCRNFPCLSQSTAFRCVGSSEQVHTPGERRYCWDAPAIHWLPRSSHVVTCPDIAIRDELELFLNIIGPIPSQLPWLVEMYHSHRKRSSIQYILERQVLMEPAITLSCRLFLQSASASLSGTLTLSTREEHTTVNYTYGVTVSVHPLLQRVCLPEGVECR